MRKLDLVNTITTPHLTRTGTHCVPTKLRGKAGGVATWVASSRDVVECRRTSRVQERVQESKRGFTCCSELVVQQGYDTSEDRRRGRRAGDQAELATVNDSDVPALCGDIGEPTAIGYELAAIDAGGHKEIYITNEGEGRTLVRWTSEDCGEAAG